MTQINLAQQLAKSRRPLSQVLWGIGISTLAIVIDTLLWKWVSQSPFLILTSGVVLSCFYGGGLFAGLTASILLTLYSFSFSSSHHGIPQLIFFTTDVWGSFLLHNYQMKIRQLAGAEVRAEEAHRLRFAAAAAKLGIWEWDIEKDFLTWDEQMLAFYGIDRESFSGQVAAWQNGVHPDDVKKATEALELALKGEQSFDLEFRVLHPDGQTRTIKANGLVIRDENGKPLKMFGLNRDVTDEKRRLEQIFELKAYFEAALLQSQAGIIVADAPDGLIRFANTAALRIAGGEESVLVKNVDINRYGRWRTTELDGTPVPNQDLPLARAIRLGESSSRELMIVRANGEKRVVLSKTAPIRREDGSIMSGITVLMDITEQQNLMEELKSAREAAEVAMRAKAKFLDIAAHELRTPVTAVSLLAQLIQRKIQKGESFEPSMLDRMRIQLDRLSRLVVDLLEVSKLDRGALELKPEITNLNNLISDCQTTFQFQFPHRAITFTPSKGPAELMIDPVKIYEVVSNLLDNAIKYSPETSPIEMALENKSDTIRFSIRDHGPGLSEESKRKLFTAFERGAADEKTSGLGLGLFICRGIIGLHKGLIGVSTSKGNGSTFYFDLPKEQVFERTGS